MRMLIVHWGRAIGTIAAVFFFTGAAAAQDCSLKKMASFDMVQTKSGGIAIPVALNGTTELLRVNLNGMYSGITSDVVAQLGLDQHRIENGMRMVTDAGTSIDHYVQLSSVAIGSKSGSYIPFEVEPGTKSSDGVAGDLGADLLRNFDVDLDFGAHKINLFSPDHCPGKVVYWGADYVTIPLTIDEDGVAFLPVLLDGHELRATINTMNYPTTLDSDIAARVYGIEETSPGVQHLNGAKPDDIVRYAYRFKSLSLSGVEVKDPLIEMFDGSVAENALRRAATRMELDVATVGGGSINSSRLQIGLDILSKLHLYLAYGEKMLYFSAAGPAKH